MKNDTQLDDILRQSAQSARESVDIVRDLFSRYDSYAALFPDRVSAVSEAFISFHAQDVIVDVLWHKDCFSVSWGSGAAKMFLELEKHLAGRMAAFLAKDRAMPIDIVADTLRYRFLTDLPVLAENRYELEIPILKSLRDRNAIPLRRASIERWKDAERQEGKKEKNRDYKSSSSCEQAVQKMYDQFTGPLNTVAFWLKSVDTILDRSFSQTEEVLGSLEIDAKRAITLQVAERTEVADAGVGRGSVSEASIPPGRAGYAPRL